MKVNHFGLFYCTHSKTSVEPNRAKYTLRSEVIFAQGEMNHLNFCMAAYLFIHGLNQPYSALPKWI
ncbi:hypothetical protein C1E23_08245 [Pseudoalteromonas phenolica]|uniref:Uncharacterized protein n=1 Tax=Pseudoalteromonas phenolica TaxID=161398 RepID=A0A4Q7IQ87_9GAMM|nr:hypothetical protein C1E23_08245 [Pseudoalteromonas phenolica]